MKYLITATFIILTLIISVSAQDDNNLEQRISRLELRVEQSASTTEQLMIEFADELALLNVKFSTLEDKVSPEAMNKMEMLIIELADELALLNVKWSTLEDLVAELRNKLDNVR